jgi:hypothetical protein
MPSTIAINTVSYLDIIGPEPSNAAVLFSAELATLFKSPQFPTLFAPNSIASSKLAPVLGVAVATQTLSGYNGPTAPGQIAPRTIDAINIKKNGVTGVEGGVPPGSVIFYAGIYVPDGYYLCDGGFKNVNTDRALFEVIGFEFGEDGASKFRLPSIDPVQGMFAIIKY